MAAEAIDTLIAVIGSDVRGFTEGVQRVNSDLDSISGRMTKFGTNTAALGGIITAATLPLVAMAKEGIETAAAFDSVMKQVELFGGLSGKQFDMAREKALKLGADTIFTAQDAGKAMLDMLKSGIAYNDMLAMIGPTADLATAGNLSLEKATAATTNVMAMFGLKANQTTRVVNALAQAANASRADVADLSQAFVSGGSVAAAYGLSVEDTAAMFGIMADRGIKGAHAGTALRSMLNNMTRDTRKSMNAWKQLGIEMFDSTGKMRPMSDLIADMDKVLSSVPDKTRIQIVKDLAGTYGQSSLYALLAEGSLKKMRGEMAKSPTAAGVAEKAMDTFEHSIESLRGSIETLNIKVFTPFMNNVLKPMVNQLIPIINKFAEWASANEGLVTNILKVLAAVVLLGPAIALVGGAITAIGAALGIVTGPIGIIIAAIAALGLAWQTNFLGIRDTLQPVVDAVGQAFDTLKTLFTGILSNDQLDIGTRLRLLFNSLQIFFTDLGSKISDWISETAPKVVKAFEILIGRIGEWLATGGPGKLAEGLAGLISGMVNWLTTTAVPTVVGGFRKLWEGVVTFFQSEGVQAFIIGMGKWLSDTYKWLTDTAMPSMVDAMVQGILGFFKWLASDGSVQFQSGVRNWFTEAINWVGTVALPGLIKMIEDFIKEVARLGSKIVETLANSVSQGLTGKVGDVQIDPMKGSVSVQGGAGELLGSIMNAIWGGGKAGGGPVSAGMNYLVGERGPEVLSMGSKPGFITPNAMLGSGGGGYNGPQSVEVVLQADGFEERIVLKLAQAQRAGKLKAQAT